MASILIRDLDEELKKRLRLRAAELGHSMEEEARKILRDALIRDAGTGADLFRTIRERVEPFGGVELEIPPRGPMRKPPDFGGSDE